MADPMNPCERQIYNSGVKAALVLARGCADQIEKMPGYKVTRRFFSRCLREFAETGEALLVISEQQLKEQAGG
jgi:hypothetical protein